LTLLRFLPFGTGKIKTKNRENPCGFTVFSGVDEWT
jgi:hypothetical protein